MDAREQLELIKARIGANLSSFTFKGDGDWGHSTHMTNACKWLRDNGIWEKDRGTPDPRQGIDRATCLDIAAAQEIMAGEAEGEQG